MRACSAHHPDGEYSTVHLLPQMLERAQVLWYIPQAWPVGQQHI